MTGVAQCRRQRSTTGFGRPLTVIGRVTVRCGDSLYATLKRHPVHDATSALSQAGRSQAGLKLQVE